jgi:hypothetical protein
MNLRTVVETGDVVCPYCDKRVRGRGTTHGGEIMHPACYAEFGAEMDRIYRDDANVELLVAAAELRFAEGFQLLEDSNVGDEASCCASDLRCGAPSS